MSTESNDLEALEEEGWAKKNHAERVSSFIREPTTVLVRSLLTVHSRYFYRNYLPSTLYNIISDHARMHPQLNGRAAVRAVLHPLRADAAHALMAARHGDVRLRASHAHDARALAANGGLGSVVAAGDVAGIGERQNLLRRSHRRLSALPHATSHVGFRESRRRRLTDADAPHRPSECRLSNRAALAAPLPRRLAQPVERRLQAGAALGARLGARHRLLGELARGAVVELAPDCVEGAARHKIIAPLEGWVTARLLEPLSASDPEPPLPPEEEDGPRLENGQVTDRFIKASLAHLKAQKLLKRDIVVEILRQAKELLEAEHTVVDFESEAPHVTVCGDVHGQFYDLLTIFETNGLPSPTNPYIFNGDFVDRGSFSFEVAITLLSCKVRFPACVHLNRGNHETRTMARFYGFDGEVRHKYDDDVLELFHACFVRLPLCCVLHGRCLVVHGGLPSEDVSTLDDIRKIERRCEPPEMGLFCDVLWSDPQPFLGRQPSRRGVGLSFGPDVTQRFLERSNLALVVRSHEVRDKGYEVEQGGLLITVFSAPNYCDAVGNQGAFVHLARDLVPRFATFAAAPHPPIRPMAYSTFAALGFA